MQIERRLGDASAYPGWAQEHEEWLAAQVIEAKRRVIPTMGSAAVFTLCFIGGQGGAAADDRPSHLDAAFEGWEAFTDGLVPGDRFTVAKGCTGVERCQDALRRARGRYFIVVPPRVVLNRHALWMLAAAALASGTPAIIFSDCDRLDPHGARSDPQFRTGWDPDLALAGDPAGIVYAVRIDAARDAGGYRDHPTLAAALLDMLLRVALPAMPQDVVHVPAILWHSCAPPEPSSLADGEASRSVVRQILHERRTEASLSPAPLRPAWSRVMWALPTPAPAVSVIVPMRDRADLLSRCADGVLNRTSYPSLELIIVDNGSVEPETAELLAQLLRDARVRLLPFPGPFNFAAMNNRAAADAGGDILVFLNNDTDVIHGGWLAELVSHAVRPDVGAVGAKLLYPDGRVQHCGVTIGPEGTIGHQFRFSGRNDAGPFGELAVTRTVPAVTGACLAMRRAVFHEVGGFDAERFRVAFNDIDLCLRLGDFGYRVVCTPFAELYHLESVCRGLDDTPEKKRVGLEEYRAVRELWDPLLNDDRFCSPHLVTQWDHTAVTSPLARPTDDTRAGISAVWHSPVSGIAGVDLLRARAASRARDARRYAQYLQARLDERDLATGPHEAGHVSTAAKLAQLEQAHRQVVGSTAWKLSWPLRRIGESVPAPARARIRSILALAWRATGRGG